MRPVHFRSGGVLIVLDTPIRMPWARQRRAGRIGVSAFSGGCMLGLSESHRGNAARFGRDYCTDARSSEQSQAKKRLVSGPPTLSVLR